MDKHDTLLIACGTPDNRQHLRGVFQERYHLLEATNCQQMLLLLRQNVSCIAALVLDVTVPEKLDMALLQQQSAAQLLERVPVILISGEDSPEMLHQGFSRGAADVIPLDYESYAMLRRVETIVELHLHKQYLEAMVQEQAAALRHTSDAMVDALSSIIEYRSVESGQHILRIRHFTKILLEEVVRSCPEYGLNAHTVAIISSASALHDIGKIAIPDAILMKPGRLTEEEMEVMKTHAITGCHILDTLGDMADKEYLRYAHNICHYHHERWDGKGYPEGLSGDDIPICAQVVGLADVYDALTTKRVYKDAYSFAQTVNMIVKGACGTFSPKLLECFKHVADQFEDLARDYADGLSPNTQTFDTTLPAPRQQQENSLERVRGKYTALVHYIDGLLMEVDLDKDRFHLVYNPYPQLSWINEAATFSDAAKALSERILSRGECLHIDSFLREELHNFVDADLRRSTQYFEIRNESGAAADCFEVTLLRISPIDTTRRTLAVLCRRMTGGRKPVMAVPEDSGFTFRCRNDASFTLETLGSHLAQLAGYTRQELREAFSDRLLELVLPEDREPLCHSFREQLSRGTAADAEFRVCHKDGSIRWVLDKARLYLGQDGREYLSCILSDISESRRAYDELNDKLRRYEIILAQTENVLFEWDVEKDIISFSDTWEKLFGFLPTNSSVRSTMQEGYYFHPDDLPLLMDRISNLENGSNYEMVEVRIATARGRYLWCRFRASAIREETGKLAKVAGIIINIDAEKQAQRLLQDRAERDSLTKLLNKTAGRKYAEEYLSRFPQGISCTMLIIDLDNFKEVNDRHGHLFGDAVLTKAAREIEKLFRPQDIVARIGGDEFLVLMRGVSDRQLVSSRCQRLLNIFAAAFQSARQKLPLSCSIGIALSPEHGTSYYELFNRADQALYRAKARGKNGFCFYEENQEQLPTLKSRPTAVGAQIDSDVEPGLAEDNLVRHAFQKLYAARDMDQAVNEVLELVGRKTNVSRVYVFENAPDNRTCRNTYEWCNDGISPEIHTLQSISYETDIPGYADNFDEKGIFYCPDVDTLPARAREIVEAQGIRSMLQCAIREGGVFRGYIGFDECVEKRLWTKEQIRILEYFSEVLGSYLLHQRQRQQALIQAQELNSILDNQSGWLYIIDPDSFRLKYLNRKTAAIAPEARCGMYCYQALMGKPERCAGCPAGDIGGKDVSSAILRDEKFGLEILAEATAICWQGENSCLMSCRALPGAASR